MGMDSAIDLKTLERLRTLGGKDLLEKMVVLFTSHAESAIHAVAAGIASGDLESVRRAAHSLKSSAGSIGASRVRVLADHIESLAEQKNTEIHPILVDLENAYRRAKGRLTEELKKLQ